MSHAAVSGHEIPPPPGRLKNTKDFQRVFDGPGVLHGANVVLFYRPNGRPETRFGTPVSKKHGVAVKRNRIKRVLREAYRLAGAAFPPGYDVVVLPRKEVEAFATMDVRKDFEKLGRRMPVVAEFKPTQRTRPPQKKAGAKHKTGRGKSVREKSKTPKEPPVGE